MKHILFISGSLRAESYNTKLLKAVQAHLPEGWTSEFADTNLPLFNEDVESDFPAAAQALKAHIAAADTIVIATPEYNRATTPSLKNALDWASRPYGHSVWPGKRVFVLSASVGGVSGAIAHYQVKQILMHMGAEVPSQPEFMLGHAADKFNESGELIDDTTKTHIAKLVEIL